MSTSDKICKDVSSNDDGVCEMIEKLQRISTIDNNVSVCANCGKEGDDVNNICNKCKVVKYCNAVCKKVHKKKHKKDCEEYQRLAAELHDEKLFKQPPPAEDCPICFIRIPTLQTGSRYKSCCGKLICSGCCSAPVYDNHGNEVDIIKQNECEFCRVVAPYTLGEAIEREKKRLEKDDPIAIYNIGNYYRDGNNGFPQDHKKAFELYHRAGELGNATAYCSIGYAYDNGRGIEVDKKKAKHYYELAAIGGDEMARHNLGVGEDIAGNKDRALRHYMIAVRGGYAKSLEAIKELFTERCATKEDYTKALQSYQEYLGEIKSPQRDEAAAFDNEKYRYY